MPVARKWCALDQCRLATHRSNRLGKNVDTRMIARDLAAVEPADRRPFRLEGRQHVVVGLCCGVKLPEVSQDLCIRRTWISLDPGAKPAVAGHAVGKEWERYIAGFELVDQHWQGRIVLVERWNAHCRLALCRPAVEDADEARDRIDRVDWPLRTEPPAR